jgi:hypothetical protein
MLAFHLDGGPSPPWHHVPGGWAAGANRVEPFRHPALEDFALVAGDRLVVVVRERCAGAAPLEATTGAGPGEVAVVAEDHQARVLAELKD